MRPAVCVTLSCTVSVLSCVFCSSVRLSSRPPVPPSSEPERRQGPSSNVWQPQMHGLIARVPIFYSWCANLLMMARYSSFAQGALMTTHASRWWPFCPTPMIVNGLRGERRGNGPGLRAGGRTRDASDTERMGRGEGDCEDARTHVPAHALPHKRARLALTYMHKRSHVPCTHAHACIGA